MPSDPPGAPVFSSRVFVTLTHKNNPITKSWIRPCTETRNCKSLTGNCRSECSTVRKPIMVQSERWMDVTMTMDVSESRIGLIQRCSRM